VDIKPAFSSDYTTALPKVIVSIWQQQQQTWQDEDTGGDTLSDESSVDRFLTDSDVCSIHW